MYCDDVINNVNDDVINNDDVVNGVLRMQMFTILKILRR